MRIFNSALYWSVLLIMVACSADDNLLVDPDSQEEAHVTVSVNANSSFAAEHLPGESTIRSATFHVFNADGSRDTKNPQITIREEGNVFRFAVNPGLKTIVVAANHPRTETTYKGTPISYFTQVLSNEVVTKPTGSANVSGDIRTAWTGIPMHGQGTVTAVAGEISRVTIEVKRLLSRMDAPTTKGTIVNLRAGEKERLEQETGKTFGDQLDFRLDAYILVNGGYRHCIFPNYGVSDEYQKWTRWFTPLYTASTYDNNGQLKTAYSSNSFLENNEQVYVYENSPKLDTNPNDGSTGYKPSTVYAFILKGELSDENGTTATRYWRLNIAKNSSHNGRAVAEFQILRNAIYKTNILEVLTAGYETPQEAEEERPWITVDGEAGIETELTVIGWNTISGATDF